MKLDALRDVPYFLTRWQTLVHERADKTLVVDGATDERLSVADVEQTSGKVYAYLRQAGVGADDFVMLCLPRGASFVAAMLGVWKAGAAFTVVEDDYAPDRIAFIREDVGCKVFIDKALFEQIQATGAYEEGWREAADHDAAFAVYTSGTTGFPKGIVHEYGNIRLNSLSGRAPGGRRVTAEDRYAVISPMNFVASIKIVLSLVQLGFEAHILPYDVVKNPLRLRDYYQKAGITISFLSPSILRIIGKDLPPTMRWVFTGSESASGVFLEGIRLVNTYSMSEGAFTLAQYEITEPMDVVPVGKPNWDGIVLHLLDEDGNDVDDGEMGEIAFENPFMRGYLHLPEQTAEAMRGGLYHTGDLARRLADGNLVLLGRANDMIKINGNRIEPAEIEKAFNTVTGASFSCAKGFEDPGHSFICLYYTDDLKLDENAVREAMRETLPYYMIPSHFVHLDTMPLLPNGKIDKKMLQAPDSEGYTAPYVAPTDELETLLCNAMATVLKRDRVGIKDDFYRMGGDSLATMELLALADLSDLTAADVFNGCTVEGIAQIYRDRLAKRAGVDPQLFELEARRRAYEPYDIQSSLFDMQLYSPKHPVFSLSLAYRFDSPNEADHVVDALNRVISESPIFSTVFSFDPDLGFVERYVEGLASKVEVVHTTEDELERIKAEFTSYFPKLCDAPLYRAGVFATEKAAYLFVLFHHALIDGMGLQVFLSRFLVAYQGKELPMDTFYTSLRRSVEHEGEPEYEQARAHMEATYGGVEWTRNFATDRDEGENLLALCPIPLEMDPQEMDDFERRTGATRNQLCAVALMAAVARTTGTKDVMMASAFHNRVDHASKNALGIQIRKVPTALRFGELNTLADVFQSVQRQSADAIRYCAYEYIIPREVPFTTDFVTMTYETAAITSGSVSSQIGMKAYQLPAGDGHAPIKMFYQIFETKSAVKHLLGYSKRFYSDEAVGRYAEAVAQMLTRILRADSLDGLTVEELLRGASC